MVKAALTMFVTTKNAMSTVHKFAVVVLLDSAVLVEDFTEDVARIICTISTLEASGEFDTFDMASVYNLMCVHLFLTDSYR